MKYAVFSIGLILVIFAFSAFSAENVATFVDAGKGEVLFNIFVWAVSLGCILIALSGIMHYIDKLSKKLKAPERVTRKENV